MKTSIFNINLLLVILLASFAIENVKSQPDYYYVTHSDYSLFVAGSGDQLIRSKDFGNLWFNYQSLFVSPTYQFNAVATSRNILVLAASDNGQIMKSMDGGLTFRPIATGTDESINDIKNIVDGTFIACCDGGVVIISYDMGETWNFANGNFSPNDLTSICRLDQQNLYIVGDNSTFVVSHDGGNTWQLMSIYSDACLNSIDMSDLFRGEIGGDGGLILKTTDGGLSWQAYPANGTSNDIYCVKHVSEGMYVAVGQQGMSQVTTDDGTSWNIVNSYVSTDLYDVDFINGTLGYAVGENNTILMTHDGGLSWHILGGGKVAKSGSDQQSGMPDNSVPNTFSLSQNYPNPFNPTTKISFQLPKASNVSIKVFDAIGKEVATLVNDFRPAGSYTVDFDARGISSGVYFYRIEANGFKDVKKMILNK